MAPSIISLVDNIATAYGVLTKRTMPSMCSLDAVADQHTFVGDDGSMCTVIRIDGTRKAIGSEELDNIVDRMGDEFGPMFGGDGVALQVWFSRNPDAANTLVQNLMQAPRRTADQLGLDLEDLFEERERNLPKNIVWEGFYFALWTRPTVLPKEERKQVRADMRPPKEWPSTLNAQDFFKIAHQIHTQHQSYLAGLQTTLGSLGIRHKVLTTEEALPEIRKSIYPDQIDDYWAPVLPDKLPAPRYPEDPEDLSHLLPPKIKDQLFDRESYGLDARTARIGDLDFQCIDMHLGPRTPRTFDDLLNRVMNAPGREFPWRVSFLIEGDGLASIGVKQGLAAILKITNRQNELVRSAVSDLNELRDDHGWNIPRLRVSFATWAPAGEARKLNERARHLQSIVNGWGDCQTSPLTGDPVAATMTNALAMGCQETAPSHAPVMSDMIQMLPWNRDASPFERGAVLFRTPDGRPWPYEPGSKKQHTWIDLVFAPPGLGKSVFLNTTNLALCLSHAATVGTGGAELPQISIVDIGGSSRGLISLIQEALPADRRHEAIEKKLKMEESHAINPFDTMLGARQPLPTDRSFLINFITLLGTPMDGEPPAELPSLAATIVDELYNQFDDRGKHSEPRYYIAGENTDVDNAIAKHNLHIESEKSRWWDVVDALFDVGDYAMARRAQCYAVPRLEDVTDIVTRDTIQQIYGDARLGNEKLLSFVHRMITTSLKEYPILKRPTRFDVSNAKVISLDLTEAAPQGGPAADKQTALVYLLGRFVLARSFYLEKDSLGIFPERYRAYQTKRIKRLREVPKRLVFDEFHRTAASQQVRDQVMTDIREGRKYSVQIMLASQSLKDFDERMVEFATGNWIMGVNQKKEADEVATRFGLSNTAAQMIKRLGGPEPGRGAPFLCRLVMQDSQHEHKLYNNLGPNELWAFSTSAQDAQLRDRLYSLIGPKEARRRLADRFPKGTAADEIDQRTRKLEADDPDVKENEREMGVIEALVQEITQQA